ncbi:MAG: VWA domain-containing protein [Planctomycetota bacterium]|nr:MAG: VWA domain-containing protein [Planctomycetota bacterium]
MPWIGSFYDLQLQDPWMLLLGVLLPLMLVLRRRRKAVVVRFSAASFTTALPHSGRQRFLWLPSLLQVLAFSAMVVALARPMQRMPLPLEAEGLDLFLCLDRSSSMAAKDMDPERSRLEVAKRAAGVFLRRRPHDRIGLIGFAYDPDLRCPLTLDHQALERFLEQVDMVQPESPEDRTGIGLAVARAAQWLHQQGSPSKVVVLFTDGEENVATAEFPKEIGPLDAAYLCRELGVRVYTIAAGLGQRGRDGSWIPVNTDLVQRLAEETGGAFFQAPTAAALDSVYDGIHALETTRFQQARYQHRDRFGWFLAAALLLLGLRRWLQSSLLEVLP